MKVVELWAVLSFLCLSVIGVRSELSIYPPIPESTVIQKFTLVIAKEVLPEFPFPRITINGTTPGPALNVTLGNIVEITVINNIADDATAVHWHGLTMKDYPWSDGLVNITQCAIPHTLPDNVMVYTFQPESSGTYWYHGHYHAQQVDGLYGPLIVVHPQEHQIFADNNAPYLHDDPTWIFTMIDYYESDTNALVQKFLHGGLGPDPIPDAFLVNNHFANSSTWNLTAIPKNETLRIRIINGAANSAFNISIDGMNLTVIEFDGVPIRPFTVSVLSLQAAQRASVVLNWNDNIFLKAPYLSPAIYMRIVLDARFYPQYIPNQVMISTVKQQPLVVLWKGLIAFQQPSSSALQQLPTYSDQDANRYQAQGYQSHNLNYLEAEPLYYNLTPDPDYYINITASFKQQSSTNMLVGSINGASMMDPGGMLMTSEEEEEPILFSYMSLTPNDTLPQYPLPAIPPNYILGDGVNPFLLPMNKVIEMTIFGYCCGVHPFHIHGHHVWIVSSSDMPTTTAASSGLHLVRDVINVPMGGWVKVRFLSNNPGVWMFHCHLFWHMEMGLGAFLLEGLDEIVNNVATKKWILPPTALQACHMQPSNNNNNTIHTLLSSSQPPTLQPSLFQSSSLQSPSSSSSSSSFHPTRHHKPIFTFPPINFMQTDIPKLPPRPIGPPPPVLLTTYPTLIPSEVPTSNSSLAPVSGSTHPTFTPTLTPTVNDTRRNETNIIPQTSSPSQSLTLIPINTTAATPAPTVALTLLPLNTTTAIPSSAATSIPTNLSKIVIQTLPPTVVITNVPSLALTRPPLSPSNHITSTPTLSPTIPTFHFIEYTVYLYFTTATTTNTTNTTAFLTPLDLKIDWNNHTFQSQLIQTFATSITSDATKMLWLYSDAPYPCYNLSQNSNSFPPCPKNHTSNDGDMVVVIGLHILDAINLMDTTPSSPEKNMTEVIHAQQVYLNTHLNRIDNQITQMLYHLTGVNVTVMKIMIQDYDNNSDNNPVNIGPVTLPTIIPTINPFITVPPTSLTPSISNNSSNTLSPTIYKPSHSTPPIQDNISTTNSPPTSSSNNRNHVEELLAHFFHTNDVTLAIVFLVLIGGGALCCFCLVPLCFVCWFDNHNKGSKRYDEDYPNSASPPDSASDCLSPPVSPTNHHHPPHNHNHNHDNDVEEAWVEAPRRQWQRTQPQPHYPPHHHQYQQYSQSFQYQRQQLQRQHQQQQQQQYQQQTPRVIPKRRVYETPSRPPPAVPTTEAALMRNPTVITTRDRSNTIPGVTTPDLHPLPDTSPIPQNYSRYDTSLEDNGYKNNNSKKHQVPPPRLVSSIPSNWSLF